MDASSVSLSSTGEFGLSAKYYVRPRKEENPKKWLGPFDVAELRQLADRRQFSKELHEFSEDRLNWLPAKQIWTIIFPKNLKPIVNQSNPGTDANRTTPTVESASFRVQASANVPEQNHSHASAEEPEEWFYAVNGSQHGPVTISQLRQILANGDLQPKDLVWSPRLGDQWVEAQTVLGLASREAKAGFGISETQRRPITETAPLAVASLVLGIVGTCIPLGIGSVLAVIFGHMALARLNQGPDTSSAKRFAIAGIALGYTMIGIILIAAAAYLAII